MTDHDNVTTEYRIIDMPQAPHISGIYSTAALGDDDALKAAQRAHQARGGTLQYRTITRTHWQPYTGQP